MPKETNKPKEDEVDPKNADRFVWQEGDVTIREPTEAEKKLLEDAKRVDAID